MIFGHEGDYPPSISDLNGKTIDYVDTFRYLGAEIDYKSHLTGDTEINNRVDSAEGKFYQHGKKFFNKMISLKTRVNLLNSLVRSRLTYGCQVWSLTANQYGLLNTTYNRMLRIMIRNGFKRKENSWAFAVTNEELYKICGTEHLEKFIYRQQRAYVAHVIRRDESSISKRLMFNADTSHRRGVSTNLLKTVLAREGRPEEVFYIDCIQKKL